MDQKCFEIEFLSKEDRLAISLMYDSQNELNKRINGVVDKYKITEIIAVYYKPFPWKRVRIATPAYKPYTRRKETERSISTTTKGDFGEMLSEHYARSYVRKAYFHGAECSKLKTSFNPRTSNPDLKHGIDHIFVYRLGKMMSILIVDTKTDGSSLAKGQMSFDWIKERVESLRLITAVKSDDHVIMNAIQNHMDQTTNPSKFKDSLLSYLKTYLDVVYADVSFQVWVHDFQAFTTSFRGIAHDDYGNVVGFIDPYPGKKNCISNMQLVKRFERRFLASVGKRIEDVGK